MTKINEKTLRLVTKSGFAAEFWAELRRRRRVNAKTTRQEVFEILNDEFEAAFGEPRWPSFDTFRHSKEYRQ